MTWKDRKWIRAAGSLFVVVCVCSTPAALRAEDCHFAGNLVPNCGFDTDLSTWYFESASATHLPGCGPHTPGCVELTPLDIIDAVFVMSACIPVSPSTRYRAGATFRQFTGVIDNGCYLQAAEYSNDCGVYAADAMSTFFASSTWQDVALTFVTSPATVSAQVRAYCSSSQQFSLRLDDFILAEGVPTCVPDADSACLLNGRFRVEVRWTDFSHVEHDALVASAGTADSALFYWNDPNNWEVLIKAIDACSYNDKFWIYLAAATNVGYEITVTDTVAGGPPKIYSNPLGTLAPAINDSAAFDCP
jgi:hypothetical protein